MKLMKDIPDGSIDLILCDPPYGVTSAEWDSILPFDELWVEYNRVLKPNGAVVLFAAQPFTTQLINSNPNAYRYCWYWLKNMPTGFAFARYQPLRRIEDICVFYRKKPTYNPQGLVVIPEEKRKVARRRKPRYGGLFNTLTKTYTTKYTNYPKNVLQFDCERGLHPTQKPVALLEYLIRTYTNEGDTILDNCMGSGSTGVAAVKVGGRHFIGIEQNENYYTIAQGRIKEVMS